jgi:hypothetical protein
MSGTAHETRIRMVTMRESELPATPGGYVPGVCNIGPWEIRRRRAFAVLGFAVAVLLFGVLVALDAPAVTRLLLLLPLAGGAFSWLQARRRFCAGFAVAGIANFGDRSRVQQGVQDAEARRADLAAVRRMARDALLIAVPLTILAVILPV